MPEGYLVDPETFERMARSTLAYEEWQRQGKPSRGPLTRFEGRPVHYLVEIISSSPDALHRRQVKVLGVRLSGGQHVVFDRDSSIRLNLVDPNDLTFS